MHTRRVKYCLVSMGLSWCLVAVLLVAWGVRRPAPLALDARTDMRDQLPSGKPQPVSTVAVKIDENDEVWRRPYQRPLVDPRPAVSSPVAAPAKAQPLNLKLMGTILEPGRERAIISTAGGGSVFRKVGEQVGDAPATAEVVQIARDRVVVRYNGELVTLEIQKSKGT